MRGFSLAIRCYLCLFDEENVDHIMLYCVKMGVLWQRSFGGGLILYLVFSLILGFTLVW